MLDVPRRAIAAGNVTLVRCREPSRECRIAPQRFAGDREDERPRLRRAVAVVETTEEGQGDDAALLGWLDGARLGRILLEREVRPRAVVQVPTRMITRRISGGCSIRGIRCTDEMSSSAAASLEGRACFAVRVMMMTSATIARCRYGCFPRFVQAVESSEVEDR